MSVRCEAYCHVNVSRGVGSSPSQRRLRTTKYLNQSYCLRKSKPVTVNSHGGKEIVRRSSHRFGGNDWRLRFRQNRRRWRFWFGASTSGTISSNDNSAEIYDPSKGRWKSTGSMNVARAVTAATLLPSGQVLISGGNSTSAGGRSAELYSNGHWSLTTSMNVPRQSLTATLLTNGEVLVFGGSNLESNATEFYNANPATWSRTHCFCVSPPIGGHTETLLPAGKVPIAGGWMNITSFSTPASTTRPQTPGRAPGT